MVRYSLALLSVATAAVLFSGCGDGGCCATPSPTAVIAGLKAGEVITRENFTLSGIESHDNNSNGRVVDYLWTVNGTEVASGYTLPVGTHDVCLTVTDNDGLTDKTCGKVTITATTNQAPTARITPALPTSCTAGQILNVSGATSSDTDGNIASYAWTPASIGTSASSTVTCPSSGPFQVCLTVTDNDGATHKRCSGDITVAQSALKKPIIELSATGSIANGFNITCTTIKDQDTVDTDSAVNPYGTDSAIKEIYWRILYGNGTITDWNQTAFNIQEPSPYDDGYCGKWVNGQRGGAQVTVIEATPVDDEDDNKTYTYELNEATGSFVSVP